MSDEDIKKKHGLFDRLVLHCTTEKNMRRIVKEGIIPREEDCLDSPHECALEPDLIYFWNSVDEMCDSLVGSGFMGSGGKCALVLMRDEELETEESISTAREPVPPERILSVIEIPDEPEEAIIECLFRKWKKA